MRELIKKWRKRGKKNAARIHYKYADELRAALPVWTKITDDLGSMPKEATHEYAVFYNFENGRGRLYVYKTSHALAMYSGWKTFASHWRPITDIDYPPEQT